MVHVVHLSTSFDEVADILDWTLHCSRDLVDILRLHNGLQVVFQHLGKIVYLILATVISFPHGSKVKHTLQFGTTKIFQDIFPVRRVVITSKVRLQLSAKNLQSGTLSDTVCTDETKDLSGARHGKTVKLETVRGVTVGDLGFQIGRQVDNMDRTERTFLRTDTATDTEALGNEGDLRFGGDFDTKLTRTDDGARLLTFLATFLRIYKYQPVNGNRKQVCAAYLRFALIKVCVSKKVVYLYNRQRGTFELTLSLLTIAIL